MDQCDKGHKRHTKFNPCEDFKITSRIFVSPAGREANRSRTKLAVFPPKNCDLAILLKALSLPFRKI